MYLPSSEYRWLIWAKMFLMMRWSIFSVVGGIGGSVGVEGSGQAVAVGLDDLLIAGVESGVMGSIV